MSRCPGADIVPVGTIKYYLREGLLPAGELTSATQARYDKRHVERLELVRVLIGIGGLSINATRAVLAAIDDPPPSDHDLLGTAHTAIGPTTTAGDDGMRRARQLAQRRGWTEVSDAPALTQLAAALEGIEATGLTMPDPILDRYTELMSEVAELDVASVPTTSAADAVRFVVTATVLFEPMLLALRKLAQWEASARRFTTPTTTP